MDYPLAYYEKRNPRIIRDYAQGKTLAQLEAKYGLKEARLRQILGLPRSDRRKRIVPKLPDEILKELRTTRYRIRAELLQFGSWPYPPHRYKY